MRGKAAVRQESLQLEVFQNFTSIGMAQKMDSLERQVDMVRQVCVRKQMMRHMIYCPL